MKNEKDVEGGDERPRRTGGPSPVASDQLSHAAPKHTPGPWEWGAGWTNPDTFPQESEEWEPGGAKYADMRLLGADGSEIIPLRIDHREWLFDSRRAAAAIPEADRQLIAAAPDLYEALRQAETAIQSLAIDALGEAGTDDTSWPLRDELLYRMRAALAKVDGRWAR